MDVRKSEGFQSILLVAVLSILGPGTSAIAAETVLIGGASTAPAPTASHATAEVMRAIRASTFEVVLKKPETDPLKYEKPLPMELLPFAERNDKYQSIGTAFAIGPDRFVTAAHVAAAASGSLFGAPLLRDAQGNVYPFDRVTRFSMQEDFIEFTVTGAPRVTPLPTNPDAQLDTPVLAAGNALGEGIVARDGMLTSQTPEERDGQWKWLRFSAPASPGNSGGPLLDAQGRVLGLIARKSANENLNYAVPIARVLQAPAGKAQVDLQFTATIPVTTARKVTRIQSSFALPLPFAEFDRQLIASQEPQVAAARAQLLTDNAATVFPRGQSSRVLADTFFGPNPSFVMQVPNGNWDVIRNPEIGNTTTFGDNGLVWTFSQSGATLFRVQYPRDTDLAAARGNGQLLSEHLLRSLVFSRPIGSERVRITSLGNPGRAEIVRDDYGRVWQQWSFSMTFADSVLIVAALPTPSGYVGFFRSARGSTRASTAAEIREMMDFVQVTYSGLPPQWRAFLADETLRPQPLASWNAAFNPAAEFSLELPRFKFTANRELLAMTETSLISVVPGLMLKDDKPVWDVQVLQVRAEPRNAPSLSVYRRSRPAADAGQEPMSRWQAMAQKMGQYAGNPSSAGGNNLVRGVVGADGLPAADASFLYEVIYMTPPSVPQEELGRAGPKLTEMVKVLEK